MKRTLSFILSLVMVLGVLTSMPLTVNAASVDDLTFELNEDGTGYVVTDCDEYASGEVIIPKTYRDLPVREIGWYAFSYCNYITYVSIPETVIKIDGYAFRNCAQLVTVNIPNSVRIIESNAFYGSGLNSIEIPEGVERIGSFAFWNCEKLISVSIPNSVKSIGSDAFGYTALSNDESKWEDGVLYINNHLILADIGGVYTIKDGIKTIADGAFSGCYYLKSIVIPDSVNYIGANAFWDCGIESVTLGNGVVTIGDSAFSYSSIISLTIPESVTTICGAAFSNCYSLESISIPDSVTDIGLNAFCDTAYYYDESNWENNVLYIDNHLIKADSSVIGGEYTVRDGTITIADNAFEDCVAITNITVSEPVANIGDYAFSGCERLVSISLPDSVENIGENVFQNCDRLTTIYGTYGSVVEAYAKENGYKFIDLNHTVCKPSDWIVDKKATVYKAGSKHKECTECGEVLETATIKQLKCSNPKLSKIENTSSGVKITWGKVSGADKYDVYRKTGSSGKYSKIGTTSKTYYTDKKASSGKKYYYYIKAVNEAGSSSASSSLSKLYLADTTLSTPKSTKSGITLKWKKVTGADGYMVYRKTGSGSYSKIATVKGSTKVTYTDKSAKKCKTYTYKLKAYKSKTYSAYSNAKKIKDKY